MSGHLIPISEHLYQFADTCNVYLLRDGDAGLLVDAGSGTIVDHLPEIGVRRIEWVLHTHHHRDQCWGDWKLLRAGARTAVPEYERHLFEQAELFWQTRRIFDNYDDRSNFFTAAGNIPVATTLNDYQSFDWRGYSFYVLPAKGHTFGSSALVAQIDGRQIAFTGDLMCAGGKLYQLHAMEYTYGSAEGVLFTLQSIQALRKKAPDVCLPSHGSAIYDVPGDIRRLEQRLMHLVRLGRGLRVGGRESIPENAFLPDPKMISLSPHLLWGGLWTCANFYVVISKSGKALFFDYGHSFFSHMHIFADHGGMETMRFVEHHLDELCEEWGVTSFEVAVPTHIHDDHTCGIPHLQRHYGTQCWALRQVAEPLSDPAAWASTPCLFSKPIRVDRILEDGESFRWQEYEFRIFHAPGQTEFHSLIVGMIDGRKVAFTGDNVFLQELMPHGGQVWMEPYQPTVFRNSFRLEMHQHCADLMRQINPEVVCPGHRNVLYFSKKEIDAYCNFIERKEQVFRELVEQPANQYVDLFWLRLLPYISVVNAGESRHYRLLLRNNWNKQVCIEARLLPPPGWTATDDYQTLELGPDAQGELMLFASAPPTGDGIRRLMTAEVRVDGVCKGPLAEALVTVKL